VGKHPEDKEGKQERGRQKGSEPVSRSMVRRLSRSLTGGIMDEGREINICPREILKVGTPTPESSNKYYCNPIGEREKKTEAVKLSMLIRTHIPSKKRRCESAPK
jgi:hypothetical protein